MMKGYISTLTFGTKSLNHGSETVDAANAVPFPLSRSWARLYSTASTTGRINGCELLSQKLGVKTLEMHASLRVELCKSLKLRPSMLIPLSGFSARKRSPAILSELLVF